MLLELENPVDLKRFRQVCQSWNVIISQITKRKKDIIWGKAESLAALIKRKWHYNALHLPDIVNGAAGLCVLHEAGGCGPLLSAWPHWPAA